MQKHACENVSEDVYLMVDVIQSKDSSILKRKKLFLKTELEKRLLGLYEFLLTELSSSFCCSSGSVRPLTAGGAALSPARLLEVGREEVQG